MAILRPTPVCRCSIAPKLGLRIEAIHIGEAACGEEVVPDVANGSLDPTLLIAACDGHGPSYEAVMRGKCQVLRVESYGWTHTLQHRALQVIAQDGPGYAAPGPKRQDMAEQEAVHAGVQREVQEYAPRVRQYHHKGHQGSARLAHLDVIEMGPVDLCLLPWQGAKAQVGLSYRARAVARHDATKVVTATNITTALHHGVQSAGRECGEFGQCLADKRQIGVGLAGSQGLLRAHGIGRCNYPAYGVAVHVQLGCDGADAPELGLVQAQDLGAQFRGYGHGGVDARGCDVKNPNEHAPCSLCSTSDNAMGWSRSPP